MKARADGRAAWHPQPQGTEKMASYLLIESRDPFDSPDTAFVADVAKDLKDGGNEVTVFLVQNGVLPARRGARSRILSALSRAGVTVLADEFSLRERGIKKGKPVNGVKAAPLDVVVDAMAAKAKVIWR
jgi:predicted peroxiredoxin